MRLTILSMLFTVILALMYAAPPIAAQEQSSGGSNGQKKEEESKQELDEGFRWGGMLVRSTLELGGRGVWGSGNNDVYRSQVNLSEGLRLLGFSTEMRAEKGIGGAFDYLSYDMSNWGGDPYNTFRLRIEKHRIYKVETDYRRIDYYNFLPSYSNPLLDRGVFLGQHSFDSSRRMSNTTLTIFPDSPFQVRLGYGRNSAFGSSFTTYSAGLDEFLLRNQVRSTTDEYRLGFDWSRRRWSLTFEQGFRKLRDDPTSFQPAGIINFGNSSNLANPNSANPQQILLTGFNRSTAQRIFVPATRFALQARPVNRVTFTGRFAYSDASLDLVRAEVLTGTLFDRTVLRYFSRLGTTSLSEASQPNTLADGSINIRVTERLSVFNTFRFNHFTIAGDGLIRTSETLGQDLRGSQPPSGQGVQDISTSLSRRTALASVSDQAEGVFDATPNLVLRAGYRFTHRSARVFPRTTILEEESTLNTHTFLGGASFRMGQRLRTFFQLERGQSDNVFTRLGAKDFLRIRLRGTFRPSDKLVLTATLGSYDSTNPNPVVNNDQTNHTFTFAGSYMPLPRFSLNLAYTRTDITSKVDVVNPRTRETARQVYEANDNYADVFLEWVPARDLRLDIGYVLVNSNGTFPLNYHQPTGRIAYTLARHYTLFMDWRWWGYNEKGLAPQDYRTHALTGGFRLSF